MKLMRLTIVTIIYLLLPAAAMAGVQTSPNYTVNNGSIVSGGTYAADVSGSGASGIAIGKGVFMPPGGISSPAYKTHVGGGTLTQLPTGDANGDGRVDIADALRILQIAVGAATPMANDLANGDVAPLVNGRPSPNKQLNVGDAIVILQKSLGIVGW